MTKEHSLNEFLRMVAPLVQQHRDSIALDLRGTGVNHRQRAIMECLAQGGSQTVPDLARALQLHRQYVQLLVNEAIDAGLVEKRQNPRHLRSHLIVLTRLGGELIQEIAAQEMQTLASLAERLNEADIDTAISVAQHVFSELRRLNAEPGSARAPGQTQD